MNHYVHLVHLNVTLKSCCFGLVHCGGEDVTPGVCSITVSLCIGTLVYMKAFIKCNIKVNEEFNEECLAN